MSEQKSSECANPYCDRLATVAIQLYGRTVGYTCEPCSRPIKMRAVESTPEEAE